MASILIKNLKKSYDEVKAVDGVSLEIEKNEIFGILGPNGAGKTTTLEIVETLREPDSGEVFVEGIDIRKDPRAVKELLGVQLQSTVFFSNLSVRETVDLFGTFYRKALSVQSLLELVKLEDKASAMVDDLSGGQHKRLSIALAIVNDPSIVFLDEPTTGLDPQARRMIWDIVESLRGQDKTIVITTHYIEEAEALCDRVAIMDHGKIIALGSPLQLIGEYSSDSTINFRLRPPLDDQVVENMPGVENVKSNNGEYVVTTNKPEDTLFGIFSAAKEQGVTADEISMKRATLEDVFLKITGRRIRE